VLIVSPSASVEERDPNEELGHWLRNYREGHPQGSALDRTVSEQMVPVLQDRRRADRVLWAGLGRRPDLKADIPTIVVEFVSAGKRNRRRDYEQKRQEYLAVGVVEYWIIDRFRRTLTVVRNAPEGAQEIVVGEADVYRTPRAAGVRAAIGTAARAGRRLGDAAVIDLRHARRPSVPAPGIRARGPTAGSPGAPLTATSGVDSRRTAAA
jgi:hypothetical protein